MSDINQQLTHAVAAHGMWKARLKDAIEHGSSEFSPATVARDDQCEFGRWIHGGIDPGARLSPHYTEVRRLHAEFHRIAGRILDLAVTGRTAEAHEQLGVSGEFAHASAQLTREVTAWRHEAA